MQTGASSQEPVPHLLGRWGAPSNTENSRPPGPEDLGHPCRTTAASGAGRTERSLVDFDSLLVHLVSARMAAVGGLVADPTGLGARTAGEGRSARQWRIAQETQNARQAERNANETRRADPSSVQRGVISARHERLVTERQEAAADTGRGSWAGRRQMQPVSAGRMDQQPLDDWGQGRRGPAAQQSAPRADQPTGKPVADPQDGPVRQPAARSPALRSVPDGASQGGKATAPVSAAGVSRLAGMAGPARASGGSPSPAQAVAQLLAGRGGTESARAPGQDQAPGDPRTRLNNGRGPRTTGTKTAGDGRPGPANTSDSPESLQRARFAQLVKSIRLNVGAKSSSATIRLNPPELGRMKINVRLVGHSLCVKVDTSTAHARELITARAHELVAALREQGIGVERFEVAGVSVLDHDGGTVAGGHDPRPQGHELKRSAPPGPQQRRQGRAAEDDSTEQAEPVLAGESYAGSEARLDIRI